MSTQKIISDLPKDVQFIGHLKTPYVLYKSIEFTDSLIIYCKSQYEDLKSAYQNCRLFSQITKLSSLCFEYCGNYEQTEFSESNLRCQLLDIFEMVQKEYTLDRVIIIGNDNGCHCIMEVLDICRKLKVDIGGFVMINPSCYKPHYYKKCKAKGCIITNNSETNKKIVKKLKKKYVIEKTVQIDIPMNEINEINLLESNTDEVMNGITDFISHHNENVVSLDSSNITIAKPQMYRNSKDVINSSINDSVITDVLISMGYYSLDSILTMTETDIVSLPLEEEKKASLRETIKKMNEGIKPPHVTGSQSAESSSPEQTDMTKKRKPIIQLKESGTISELSKTTSKSCSKIEKTSYLSSLTKKLHIRNHSTKIETNEQFENDKEDQLHKRKGNHRDTLPQFPLTQDL